MTAALAVRARARRATTRPSPWVVASLLAPFALGLALFVAYPVIATLYYSFTDYRAAAHRSVSFIGLGNYVELFTQSPTFWVSVRNTLYMVLVMVPLRTAWAVLVAVLIVRVRRGQGIYRTLAYLPSMVPTVAAALAFLVVLAPGGPLNRILAVVGIDAPAWLADPAWSKPGLTMLALWGAGNFVVIVTAGLLEVPRERYEAAALDGVNGWQRFRHITLPAISPVVFFTLLTGMIYAFQYFTEAFVTSSASLATASGNDLLGAPQQSLLFYSTDLYQQGFVYFRTGYAAAQAWLLFLVILAATLLFIRWSRRFVHYSEDGS